MKRWLSLVFFFILDNIDEGSSVVVGRIGSFGTSVVSTSMDNFPESNRIDNNYKYVTHNTTQSSHTFTLHKIAMYHCIINLICHFL